MKSRKFTKRQREQIRAEEERILADVESLPPERQIIARMVERGRRWQDAKKAHTPEVGLFFVVGGKAFAYGAPYTEVPVARGVPHVHRGALPVLAAVAPDRAVPTGMEYDEAPRGRVTYSDASRKFTLFADKCIIKDKRALGKIMGEFGLSAANTNVLPDDHYRCPGCVKRNKKKEEEDWDI